MDNSISTITEFRQYVIVGGLVGISLVIGSICLVEGYVYFQAKASNLISLKVDKRIKIMYTISLILISLLPIGFILGDVLRLISYDTFFIFLAITIFIGCPMIILTAIFGFYLSIKEQLLE